MIFVCHEDAVVYDKAPDRQAFGNEVEFLVQLDVIEALVALDIAASAHFHEVGHILVRALSVAPCPVTVLDRELVGRGRQNTPKKYWSGEASPGRYAGWFW